MSGRPQASPQKRQRKPGPAQDLPPVHLIARQVPRLDKDWSCPPYCNCPLRHLLNWLGSSSPEDNSPDVKPLKSKVYRFLCNSEASKKVHHIGNCLRGTKFL